VVACRYGKLGGSQHPLDRRGRELGTILGSRRTQAHGDSGGRLVERWTGFGRRWRTSERSVSKVVQQQQPPAPVRSERAENCGLKTRRCAKAWPAAKAARQHRSRDFHKHARQKRLLQSFTRSVSGVQEHLETENAELSAKVSKLTDDLKKSHEELTGLTCRMKRGRRTLFPK